MTRINHPAFTRLNASLKQLADAQVRTGWFANSEYPNSARTKVAYVAAIQENGVPSKGIPARPFMVPTVDREADNWQDYIMEQADAVVNGSTTVPQALERFALLVESDISRSIDMVHEPPLTDSTLAARAKRRKQPVESVSKKPLIDRGILQSTIQSEIKT